MSQSFKDLRVWRESKALAVQVYRLTQDWPVSEQFGLTSQMRRAAVSVASNIAEGSARGTHAELARYIRIALGSLAELQTQLEIAREVLPECFRSSDQPLEDLIDNLRPQLIRLLMTVRSESSVREEVSEYSGGP